MDTLTLSLIAIFHKTGHGSLRQNKPNGYLKKKYRDMWMVKLRYI